MMVAKAFSPHLCPPLPVATKALRGEPSRAAGHQHRQARVLIRQPSLSSKPAEFWKRSVLIDPSSILITFWNRITGPSNAGSVQASIFAPSGQLGARHRLALGPAVRPGVGSAPAQTAQDHKRLLEGGRDVRAGERQMGVLVPGRGLQRCDDRLPSLGQTRCSGGRALSDQSLGRGEPSRAARVINTDKHAAYPPAIVELKAGRVLEEKCTHRPVQYLK